MLKFLLGFVLLGLFSVLSAQAIEPVDFDGQLKVLKNLAPFSEWKFRKSIPLQFEAFHPQGVVKLGYTFYLTSVDSSNEKGYLFIFNETGKEISHRVFQEGNRFHAGGIDYDFDTDSLWIPLSEYREKSSADILKYDLKSTQVEHVVQMSDHIGSLALEKNNGQKYLRLFNWNSLAVYSALLNALGEPVLPFQSFFHPSFYSNFAYQDCKGLQDGYVLCGGTDGKLSETGVIDLIQFESPSSASYQIIHRVKVPQVDRFGNVVPLFLPGRALTHEAMAFEFLKTAFGDWYLRFYFVPHDGSRLWQSAHVLIYDAAKATTPTNVSNSDALAVYSS